MVSGSSHHLSLMKDLEAGMTKTGDKHFEGLKLFHWYSVEVIVLTAFNWALSSRVMSVEEIHRVHMRAV